MRRSIVVLWSDINIAVTLCGMGCTHMASTSQASAPEAIFVTNAAGGYLTVYDQNANGDADPIGTMGATSLNGLGQFMCRFSGWLCAGGALEEPAGVAVDNLGNTYVSTFGGGWLGAGSIVVFPPNSRQRAQAVVRIAGPHTHLVTSLWIAVDKRRNIYVARQMSLNPSFASGVNIYAPGSSGDAKPIEDISGPLTSILNPEGIAVDSKGDVFVATDRGDAGGGAILMFAVGKRGNVRPSAVVTGPHTRLGGIAAIALDSEGNIYVVNRRTLLEPQQRVTVYSVGSVGDAVPTAIISGRATGLADPDLTVFGIAVDSGKNIYLACGTGTRERRDKVLVFAADSNGDVPAHAVLEGPHTLLYGPHGIAIGPYSRHN